MGAQEHASITVSQGKGDDARHGEPNQRAAIRLPNSTFVAESHILRTNGVGN